MKRMEISVQFDEPLVTKRAISNSTGVEPEILEFLMALDSGAPKLVEMGDGRRGFLLSQWLVYLGRKKDGWVDDIKQFLRERDKNHAKGKVGRRNESILESAATYSITKAAGEISAEKSLILGVIFQAVRDLKLKDRKGKGGKVIVNTDRISAEQYFGSDGFDVHCELVGLEPDFVRETLARFGILALNP